MKITKANTEAPKDITTYTLASCYDHIQATCSNMVAINTDMKKKLETGRSTLPDPVKIYARTIDGNINKVAAKKQAIVEALANRYALMDRVQYWPRSLVLKNQLVYPMREQLQILFASNRECINSNQLQKIDEKVVAIQAQVDQIEEESTKTKKLIRDMCPSV